MFLLRNSFHEKSGSGSNDGSSCNQNDRAGSQLGGTSLGRGARFNGDRLVGALAFKFLARDHNASSHALFGLSNPDTGIVELLVGLVSAGGVSNLALEVVTLFFFEKAKAIPICPLSCD